MSRVRATVRTVRSKLLLAMGLASCSAAALAEGAPGEELKFAVVVSRHGVRSPTWTLERLNQYSTSPWPDWGVAPGELTVHGRALMSIMGGFYRDHFSSKGLIGLCQDSWIDTDCHAAAARARRAWAVLFCALRMRYSWSQ